MSHCICHCLLRRIRHVAMRRNHAACACKAVPGHERSPGGLTERSMYPEVCGLSHSACAGFSEVQGFEWVLINE